MSEENFNTENGTNEQTYSQPQQTYSQPQQTYSQPQQTYSQPQQAYEQPQQNYDQQAYNQNQQYAQQNYGYDQSQQGYGTYQQPQQQAYGSFDQTQYGYNQPASSGKGMAIASMVLGIISIPAILFFIIRKTSIHQWQQQVLSAVLLPLHFWCWYLSCASLVQYH